MSASLSYIKGVRKRYVNILQKNVDNGVELLEFDYEGATQVECEAIHQQVKECMGKIQLYSDKLNCQSDKLTQAMEKDDDEIIQSIVNEDTEICDHALSLFYKLQSFENRVKEYTDNGFEKKVKVTDSSLSDELHTVFEHQLKLQKDFLESQKKKEKAPSVVKLPKLDVHSFHGNKLYWLEFWDSFESAVHKNDKLSNVEKFNYLKSKLNGEARSAVAGLSLTTINYDVAISILQERYGDEQEIIDLHYKQIMDLPPVRNTTESLRFFLDKVERNLRSLEVLHQNTDQELFVSMIRRKLPSDVLLQLEILKGAGQTWTVTKLRKLISQYITAKEASEKEDKSNRRSSEKLNRNQFPNQRFESNNKRFRHFSGTGASSGALLSSEKQKVQKNVQKVTCRFCAKPHWSDECDVYKTVDDRKRRIRGSCYKCLKEGHMSSDCKSSRACVYCGETNIHHRSLCVKKFSIGAIRESAHLCDEEIGKDSATSGTTGNEIGLLSSDETVLMQTATTEVKGLKQDYGENVRLLLDSGSHRTYVTEDLAKRLGLKAESQQEIHLVTFGSENTKTIKTKTTTLQIKLKDGTYMTIMANIVPNITGAIHRKKVKFLSSSKFTDLTRNLTMADTVPQENESVTLDLLLGNDYYLDITQPDKIEVLPGLYLLSSRLGWILTGRTHTEVNSGSCNRDASMLVLTFGNNLTESSVFANVDDTVPTKPNLDDFWNIEAIGITDKADRSEDREAMKAFKDTVKRVDGRYEVTWPWRDEFSDLPENRGLALGRLRSLSVKLQRQPELLKKYDSVIQDQLDKGIIETVEISQSNGRKHYIPHHVVLKPDNATTKLRIMYDASAKTRKEHRSLNESLYRGPVLLKNLCGILMRFRLHKIGIVADIEKAFLQVGLQTSERDVTRFLWFKNGYDPVVDEKHIQEYRFCRVPFGVISSPFLLGATIEHHLDTYNSHLSEQLKEDIYMDNVITGKDSVDEALELYQNAKAISSDAKMNLREWTTNNKIVNDKVTAEDRGTGNTIKVLGQIWNIVEDTLGVNKVNLLNKELMVTKRNVLKQVASVFDPLGLFSPVTMRGKVLIQKVCNQKLDWDDPLNDEDSQEWDEIKKDLEKLENFKVDRCIASVDVDKDMEYSLVCFTDASKKAYAAAVYLYQQKGFEIKSNLVFGKSRLAPVKELTIPRLELMAVLIGVRSLKFVESQMNLKIRDVYLMTDSLCVLHWIHSGKILPIFVKNRVKEIRSHSNIKFRFVNTQNNSSDVASRGCKYQGLCEDNMWWHGPTCLQDLMVEKVNWINDESKKSDRTTENQTETVRDSDRSETCEICNSNNNGEDVLTSIEDEENDTCTPLGIDQENYSSVSRLLRVTAWCLRFIKNLKEKQNQQEHLSSDELKDAEKLWVKMCQRKHFKEVHESIKNKKPNSLAKQLDVYVDESGLLRCKGRLEHADLSEATKHPILLPQNDRLTHMLIDRSHIRILHSGVSQTLNEIRMSYWIPHGRATVRSRLKKCLRCKRVEGGPYKYPNMAPLPKSRVTDSTPFSKVGIDYMGPLYVKENKSQTKVWICLFTCLVTRAVHLELVQDMSASSFILCLRRFIANRGTPTEVITDNAKHFKLTSETVQLIWRRIALSSDVQNYVSTEGIRWNFNVELAPWMGGFFERLVGIVKRSLRKAIGKKILTLDQMQTILKEAESVVNRRPLIYVGDDINSSIVITPGHFLCLNPNTGIPDLESDEDNDEQYKPDETSAEKLLRIWKKGEKLLNNFWKVWKGEYLLSLRERSQNKLRTKRGETDVLPNIGDVVLIKDDLPRGQWKLGKIIALRVSRDGQTRSAQLVMASGKYLNRPINLLFPIEISNLKNTKSNCVLTKECDISKERPQIRAAAINARKIMKQMI